MEDTVLARISEQNHYEIIPCLTEMIIELVHPAKIILFGSCARRCVRRNSDIDLCIIMPEKLDVKERARIRRLLTDNFLEITDHEVDLLIVSEDSWQKSHADARTVLGRVFSEGVLLYG